MIEASAPGRGGIIGNPSDIYGGTVVSCTIPHRAQAVISSSSKLILDIHGHYQVVENNEDLAYIPELHFLDVAKAVWRYLRKSEYVASGDIDPQATFMVRAESSIPLKAGCAGSTAMLLSVLGGVLAHFEIEISRYEMAELARKIERHEMEIHCGYQDQYMVVFGGLNCVDLREKEEHPEGPTAPLATVEPLAGDVGDLPFILANTGIQRHSGEFHAAPRTKWEQGDEVQVNGFKRIGELGRLGKKAMVTRDWEWLGELMNENYELVEDLIGCGETNTRLIMAARRHGALGAKLSGAGRGGTVIALHEDPDWLGARLLEEGAERLLRLQPMAGLTVNRIES